MLVSCRCNSCIVVDISINPVVMTAAEVVGSVEGEFQESIQRTTFILVYLPQKLLAKRNFCMRLLDLSVTKIFA